jgi:hypothetical protein
MFTMVSLSSYSRPLSYTYSNSGIGGNAATLLSPHVEANPLNPCGAGRADVEFALWGRANWSEIGFVNMNESLIFGIIGDPTTSTEAIASISAGPINASLALKAAVISSRSNLYFGFLSRFNALMALHLTICGVLRLVTKPEMIGENTGDKSE